MDPNNPNPPLLENFESRFRNQLPLDMNEVEIENPTDLPLIDLIQLNSPHEVEECKKEIIEAASTWGFFQVVNHGISDQLLESLRAQEHQIFSQPFCNKENKRLDFPPNYDWGNKRAKNPRDYNWSESYHILWSQVHGVGKTREVMRLFGDNMAKLGRELINILARDLGCDPAYVNQNCTSNTSYLRLNHYPACPLPYKVFGLIPHTDSDFITILCQDNVTGLQLFKNGVWFTVKPNPKALVINIGDLFQALSNNKYKSVEHRVIANSKVDRFTVAYFVCPSFETVIESDLKPAIYKKFSFAEYKKQILRDLELNGHKVGLSRFLA